MSKRLYVGNLSYSTTEPELREVFERIGAVTDVKVMMDRETGRPRGFAFVEMSSDEEARDAISQLNGSELGGRTLKINEAQARESGGFRGGGGGGGGGGSCTGAPAALPSGKKFCTASTKTCLASCTAGDFTCINDCITSDTATPVPTTNGGTVGCNYCLAYTEQVCAANNGCCTEYSDYKACVAANSCTTQACVKANCAAESTDFQSCVVSGTTCTDDYSTGDYGVCFQ